MALKRWLADLLKSSLCCAQVLNNFTTFYITHQIFFLTFVLLFILHPIPGHSNVYGKRERSYPWLPTCYSWVSLHSLPQDSQQTHARAVCVYVCMYV